MKFAELLEVIKKLKITESKVFYKTWAKEEIFALRPKKQSRSVKRRYKKELNFQIWLHKVGKEPFRPNHLRILIDLYLKKQSRPDLSNTILETIERIYDGEDPEYSVQKFKDERFTMKIDDIDANFYLVQLFFAEQEINYTDGKVKPPRAYLMGYLRQILETDVEIDKICWSTPRNAPQPKFWRR